MRNFDGIIIIGTYSFRVEGHSDQKCLRSGEVIFSVVELHSKSSFLSCCKRLKNLPTLIILFIALSSCITDLKSAASLSGIIVSHSSLLFVSCVFLGLLARYWFTKLNFDELRAVFSFVGVAVAVGGSVFQLDYPISEGSQGAPDICCN